MNDSNPQPDHDGGVWSSILRAAEGLPPPLRFVIVAGVLLVALIVADPAIPNNLVPLLYFLYIGGMFLYGWWEYQNFQREKAQQAHKEVMRWLELEGNKPPASSPVAGPPPASPPAPEANDLRRRYLHGLFVGCGSLSMAMIDPRAQHSQAAQLALQSVFTALDVAATQQERDVKWQTASRERDQREPALAALSRHPRLVLLGQPGSGKSTLVNFIAYCLTGEGLGHDSVNLARLAGMGWRLPGLLPVRVILRDYAARGLPAGQDLLTFLGSELEVAGLDAYRKELQRQLQQRGGILLLDGLDEVPQAHRQRKQLREAVLAFVAGFPQVRVVVTSRPYAYDADWQLPDFARARLLDFNQEQIDGYIDSWYGVTGELDPDLPPARAKQYAEQLKRGVRSNRNLAELAPRPLLLALMVSLHRWQHGGALPEKREELYDKSVDLLLDLWQRPKQLYDERGRPTHQETSALVELGIGRDELRNALSEVAFMVHRDQPQLTGTADIPAERLAGALFAAPGRKPGVDLDRAIDYVKDRAGLLEERGVDRQGRRIYAFPHRTFQEYLAACHLLAQDTFPDELVRLARQEPERWRETVLLAAGRGGAKSQALVWQLVQALCPQPPPGDLATAAEADWWGAFLAGRVLWDVDHLLQTTAPHLQTVLGRVRDWLAALVAQATLPPLDRAVAGEALDRLGWLPPDLDHWIRCASGADDGGDLLVMKYPVTNARYELFIEAGGYSQPAYWRAGRSGDEKEPRYWDHALLGRERRGYPVVGISWYEASAYAAWMAELLALARRDGSRLRPEERALAADLLAAGVTEVRLPTDAEWTRLAGGEASDRYPWDPVGGPATADPAAIRERANTDELGWGRTTPVYLYPLGASQPHGLMDLAGNAWEWTATEARGGRVVRGGSWLDTQR
ncbi:MAG: SUMF1/EgtB/PvdO family nonheme iron enzyme [Chloroflexi bacterium]|nr:SUMF1/EgtB/PvdO family nonheme iron enzyme [Chloroflexota bacterium]